MALSVLRSGQQRTVELTAIQMPDQLKQMWVEQYRRYGGENAAPEP